MRSKILIVDDSRATLRILRDALGDAFDIFTAMNGLEAIEVATRERPDLILLDVVMPDLDGYETCRRIRDDATLRFTKIVLLSAQTKIADRLAGYEAGGDDYLTKPFEPPELLAKVRALLRMKRAEELDQLKGDSLALLSHETRTPLLAIQASLEILSDEPDMPKEERDEWLHTATQGCHRLSQLLQKVLLLGELRMEKATRDPEPMDVADTVRTCIETLGAVDAEIRVTGELDQSLVGEPAWMEIPITALIENAVIHGPLGRPVEVRIESNDDTLSILVSDEGSGIDPERREAVFKLLQPDDLRHHTQGQGISLAIVREIARIHGGFADVDDRDPSRTTFRLTFPQLAGLPVEV